MVSVLPFLAIWTALYYMFGRRLLPIIVPGGSSTAERRSVLALGIVW